MVVNRNWIFNLQDSDRVPDEVIAILCDAHRFLEYFKDILSLSAMHTYTAALPLTPTSTRLYQKYAKEFEGMALYRTLMWDIK